MFTHCCRDYYLEHTHRINHLVMRLQDPNTKTLKKPSLDSFMPMKQEHRNGMPRWDPRDPRDPYQGRSSSDPYSREGSASARSTTGGTSSALGRRTQNSLSTPSAMYSEKMPPPNAEIQIPQAPSRSPTPPRRVEAKGGTHMYTPEDKEYFLRFISWRLKRNPNLTRAELCDQLAQKVRTPSAARLAEPVSNVASNVQSSYRRRRNIVLRPGDIIGNALTTLQTRFCRLHMVVSCRKRLLVNLGTGMMRTLTRKSLLVPPRVGEP